MSKRIPITPEMERLTVREVFTFTTTLAQVEAVLKSQKPQKFPRAFKMKANPQEVDRSYADFVRQSTFENDQEALSVQMIVKPALNWKEQDGLTQWPEMADLLNEQYAMVSDPENYATPEDWETDKADYLRAVRYLYEVMAMAPRPGTPPTLEKWLRFMVSGFRPVIYPPGTDKVTPKELYSFVYVLSEVMQMSGEAPDPAVPLFFSQLIPLVRYASFADLLAAFPEMPDEFLSHLEKFLPRLLNWQTLTASLPLEDVLEALHAADASSAETQEAVAQIYNLMMMQVAPGAPDTLEGVLVAMGIQQQESNGVSPARLYGFLQLLSQLQWAYGSVSVEVGALLQALEPYVNRATFSAKVQEACKPYLEEYLSLAENWERQTATTPWATAQKALNAQGEGTPAYVQALGHLIAMMEMQVTTGPATLEDWLKSLSV